MPTKLDRVQVLFQKDVFKKLKLLAKIERRSLSSMAGSLVEEAIESQKYQSLLSRAKSDELKTKIDETKVLINDILQPDIASETFDVNSKLKKIDDLLTLISKSNVQEQNESLNLR
jgi:mRNA-degrading endonuclease RelE of RelBE toxin-antitoxin system